MKHLLHKIKHLGAPLALITLLLLPGLGWGANLINENIQSWTNRGSYGSYTQAITAGTVSMTRCMVATAAAATGTCSVGRVQMEASTGIIELPALPTCGIAEFHFAAGSTGRSVKLQRYNGSTWDDLTTFTGIGTTGATFTYNVNSGSSTTLRLSSPSHALYVHDIIVTDYAVASPTITVAPSTLTGFSYVEGSGPSTAQSFTISGSDLTTDISIAASTNYEISETEGSGYTTPLTLTQTGGTVEETTIYVRLKAGLTAGDYNDEVITASSTDAENKTVTCSGSVSEPPSITFYFRGPSWMDNNPHDPEIWGPYNGWSTPPAMTFGDVPGWWSVTVEVADASASIEYQSRFSQDGSTKYQKAFENFSANPTFTTTTGEIWIDASQNNSFYWQGNDFYLLQDKITETQPFAEPDNHVTEFSATANSSTAITVTWNDSDATGYLIKGSDVSYAAITAPFDGVEEANATLVRNVSYDNGNWQFTGLTAGTTYYFKIYPYNGTGASVNYKTDGTVPEADATTDEAETLLLVENFDYSVGSLLTANGWTSHSGTSNFIPVSAGSISYDGYLSSGIGNEASLLTTGEDVNKAIASQTSGSVYASFLVNITSSQTTGDYFAHFGATSGSAVTVFGGRVWVKKDNSSENFAFGVSKSSTAANVSYTDYDYVLGNTYLVVVKYSFIDGLANDFAVLYINPSLNTTEPTPTIQTLNEDNGTNDPTQLTSFCLRQGNASNAPTLKLDGIRVATTWADIVGPAPTTWDGSASNNWNNSENWSEGVPTSSMDVIIPFTGITNFPTLSAAGTCKNITIESGASLIDNGYLTVTGTATVERYISGHNNVADAGWHLLGSPVAAFDIDGSSFDPGASDDFYAWQESNSTWMNHKQGTPSQIVPGTGYLVSYETSGTKTFTGALNAADQTVTVTREGAGDYAGFNLIGNPFASAITWGSGWSLGSVGGVAYVWDEATKDYIDIEAGDPIPSANGVMVYLGGEETSQSLTIPAAARIHSSQGWYKSAGGRIVLVANDPDRGAAKRSVIRFNESATEGFDLAWDGYYLRGFAPGFYSVSNGMNYSVNTLPSMNNTLVIPMGFEKTVSSGFSIELQESIPGAVVYLTDKKTGTVTNLTDNGAYHFTAAEGDDANRFTLHFGTLGMDDPSTAAPVHIYAYGGVVYLNGLDAKASVTITDLTGRVVMAERVNGNGLAMLNAGSLPKGVYVVTAVAGSQVVSAKVIL